MKKKLVFYLIIFIFSQKITTSNAQLLWEISGNGLTKPSYLYGTMHISDQRVFNFDPQVMNSFEKVEGMAGEMLLDPSMMFEVMAHLFMPSDTTLDMLLTDEEYQKVKLHLGQKMGMMNMFVDKMKPIFTSVFLAEQGLMDSLQSSGKPPLDMYFQELAKEKGKEVIGLETLNEQLQAFNAIPLKYQAKMLVSEIENVGKRNVANQMSEMIQIYQNEDLEKLYNFAAGQMSEDINRQLLTIRNKKMASRADKIMREKQKSLFIAVGAAHLPAENGLIDLFRKMGYEVKPLSKKREK